MGVLDPKLIVPPEAGVVLEMGVKVLVVVVDDWEPKGWLFETIPGIDTILADGALLVTIAGITVGLVLVA